MPLSFPEFQSQFFAFYEQPQFDGAIFLDYLQRSDRSGDEASVVDNVLSGPLLALLGFSSGEQTYNAVKSDLSRPDFAPKTPETGACFLVEDKATPLSLEAKWRAQLARYVRGAGLSLGLLSNGARLQLWEFAAKSERLVLEVDVCALLELRRTQKPLDEITLRPLESLFDLLRREAFTDATNLALELAVDAATWKANARKLGEDAGAEAELIEDLKGLVAQLHRDARRQLDGHLDAALELKKQEKWADDKGTQNVEQAVSQARDAVELALGLSVTPSREPILEFLAVYAENPREFPSREFLVAHVLEIHNRTATKALKAFEATWLSAFEQYAETVLSIHARQTRLRQKARAALAVEADFSQWKDLVSETMLGDLSQTKNAAEADDAQRAEFALQAAYVVFIRLLLIRVCEDKEIFPDRFLSNGGLQFWQENIKRYLKWVRGNRYEPLLQMAYDNAANIYAHFFTGRELFNWYHLSETGLLEALKRLGKYDFGAVDSDLLGTVYNAYVERHEKKKQGQYYTPRPIVDFILDEVRWRDKADILGDQKRLLDPACGSGTFLVSAAKRLMDAYRNEAGSFDDPLLVLGKIRDKIYGFDLNPFACYLAEVNLLIQVLDAVRALPDGQKVGLERFHIYNVDALAKPGRGTLALGHDSLLAEELDVVERIKTKQDAYASGFSHVVANPPYGAKLSDPYKRGLKRDYEAVFKGQPDTYVFFYALGLDLLSHNGRLGFITPNTFLMGVNTDTLRGEMLRAGRIERIVDLPQGIWKDATVDCVLLFLAKGGGPAPVEVNLLDLRDTLDKLTARAWAETLGQSQGEWSADPAHAMDIRRDAIQIAVEAACIVQKQMNDTQFAPEVLRLGELVDSSPGVDPYATEAEGLANLYIKPKRDVPHGDKDWKPLLDTTAFVGRYELRWGQDKPFIKHGIWLTRAREARYFETPKIIAQDMRNKALGRRLVATYDESQFFHRKNFNNFHPKDSDYSAKYLLALFNSRLLNHWYRRKFDNVHITIAYFEQLPIFPATPMQQAELVALVDELLATHAQLNAWRAVGYRIELGKDRLALPFGALIEELQTQTPALDTLDLADARASGHFSIPAGCNRDATLGGVRITPKLPTQITLKWKQLWLDVPDPARRQFLLGLLSAPRFDGQGWSDLENDPTVRVPATPADLARFEAFAAAREAQIRAVWQETLRLDREIDERVLDLYGIQNPQWRAKILDSAPVEEDAEAVGVAEVGATEA